MMRIAFFAPCFVDQLSPSAAIAAVGLLERLGLDVEVPFGAACCGQPPANAGFERDAIPALRRFVATFAPYDYVVVLSGSCALHVRSHAGTLGQQGTRIADRTIEFCSFLHDVVGVEQVRALNPVFPRRVAVHIGCHALRGLGLAAPSERQVPRFDKVRALLGTVAGISFAEPARPDECCGFGGSFSVTEPEVSARMARDRVGDYRQAGAEVLVSTDMSCLLHLDGIARRAGVLLPSMHVAQVLAATSA